MSDDVEPLSVEEIESLRHNVDVCGYFVPSAQGVSGFDRRILATLDAERTRREATEKVCEAAQAEVVAQGYRSSDMARALKAFYGEFWYEEYGRAPSVCGFSVVTEMDDGPLVQRCMLAPHGAERSHQLKPSYALARPDHVAGEEEGK